MTYGIGGASLPIVSGKVNGFSFLFSLFYQGYQRQRKGFSDLAFVFH